MKAKEWAETLTPGQIKDLLACETAEKQIAYCSEHGIALPDELSEDATEDMAECDLLGCRHEDK